jgi:hypothetical protein
MGGPAATAARTVESTRGVIETVWRLKCRSVVCGRAVVSVKFLSVARRPVLGASDEPPKCALHRVRSEEASGVKSSEAFAAITA